MLGSAFGAFLPILATKPRTPFQAFFADFASVFPSGDAFPVFFCFARTLSAASLRLLETFANTPFLFPTYAPAPIAAITPAIIAPVLIAFLSAAF